MDYSQYKQLEFRRKFWNWFGPVIHISTPTGEPVGYIKMAALKLRGDIRIYRDETKQQELFRIGGRQIISLKPVFDIFASDTDQKLFALRRLSLKSAFVRDHWELLDNNGNVFGEILETSSNLALARRWLELLPFGEIIGLIFAFVPQTYTITARDQAGQSQLIGNIVHRKNPIIVKMGLDTSAAQMTVDPRVCVSSAALLSILDASKNS